MENITLRPMKKSDAEAVADIQIAGWLSAYAGLISGEYLRNMASQRSERAARFARTGAQRNGLVAETDGEVVGFCFRNNEARTHEVAGADCELEAIYVDPELKRRGIGRALFEFVLKEFAEQGKKKMILWCLKDNFPSREFYETMGGVLAFERPIIIGGDTYAEVCYEYDLTK